MRRPRLLDQLHNNAHRKLTFVCAPAGYGKTTLLVDFAEDVEGGIFWYRITEQDSSLQAFFENLVLAIQAQTPTFGEYLIGRDQGGDRSPRFLALALVNAVEQSIGDYSFLILDDYHIVSDCAEIIEFVDYFLEFLPDQLRVVIGSRSVYGIPTAALYIQEQLAVIGTNELAFQPEELGNLCSQYYQINLSPAQIKRIIEESEGWIVAILLALRSETSSIEIPKILGAREHIYHYLANEVVSALPDYLKEFMYATSMVEEFSASFADYLLEIDHSEHIIKELEELNLFLSDTESGEETVYRYHQLFSDFLKEHLGGVLQEQAVRINARAARWYDQEDYPEKAVSHYSLANQLELAAVVIDRSAQKFYISGQINILEHWYSLLQEDERLLVSAPILLLDLAKHHITQGGYDLGSKLLDLANDELLAKKDYANYVNLLVTRGMLYRFTGKLNEAFETANLVQDLVDKHGLNRIYRDQAERLKGIVSFYLGDVENAFIYLDNAAAAFREAINIQPTQDQAHDLMMTLADIGHFGIAKGRIFETQKSFSEAVELIRKIPGNFTDAAIAYNNFAVLHYLLGDYVKAWRNYSFGAQAATTYHLDRYRVHIMNGQADVLRDIEAFDEARQLYESVLEFAENIGETLALVDAFSGLVEVETRTNFFNKAMYYIREVARVKKEELSAPESCARFGKVYLAMGQLELALDSFSAADQTWGADPDPRQEIVDAYFHFACVLFRLGQEQDAIDKLKKTFGMAAALGYDQFLVVAARNYHGFLEEAQSAWQSPQLQSLLKRAGGNWIKREELDANPEEPEEMVSTIQVSALGRDSVRLDGKLIESHRWQSVGARAMFFFILDRNQVTKDQIALEFWPDFSPGKVNSNFHATLWRVRNALGGKHIIEFRGSDYQVNPQVKLYYDVAQFEQLLERLHAETSETERRTLLRQCIELYQGEFLTSIDMAWADQRRSQLHNAYVQVLSNLAKIELNRKNYEDANLLFDQLILLEPYQDSFHHEKMVCLVGMGNLNGARTHYQDYRKLLAEEVGVEPATEITKYFYGL